MSGALFLVSVKEDENRAVELWVRARDRPLAPLFHQW